MGPREPRPRMNSLQPDSLEKGAKHNTLLGLVRLLVLVAALAPLALAMSKSWREVQAALTHINWSYFIFSQAILFLVMPLMASISWFTVRRLTNVLGVYQAIRLYFISQLPKYLPGGIWAFPGRMVAYQRAGVDRTKSVVSVFREVTAVFLEVLVFDSIASFDGLAHPGNTERRRKPRLVALGLHR